MANLAIVYGAERKYRQAEALFSQTLQITRCVLGPEHRWAFMAILPTPTSDKANTKWYPLMLPRPWQVGGKR
jgi:hypothetical protein